MIKNPLDSGQRILEAGGRNTAFMRAQSRKILFCRALARNIENLEKDFSNTSRQIISIKRKITNIGKLIIDYQYRLSQQDSAQQKNTIGRKIDALSGDITGYEVQIARLEEEKNRIEEEIREKRNIAIEKDCRLS